jgi:hypothetical protein
VNVLLPAATTYQTLLAQGRTKLRQRLSGVSQLLNRSCDLSLLQQAQIGAPAAAAAAAVLLTVPLVVLTAGCNAYNSRQPNINIFGREVAQAW